MINCESLGSFVYFLFAGTYGTIEFSMSYDEAEEHLVINVVKAKVSEQLVVEKMMESKMHSGFCKKPDLEPGSVS